MSSSAAFTVPSARVQPLGAMGSILSVAGLTGALGWALAQTAGWGSHHVVASLIGYAILGAIVAVCSASHLQNRPFGLANQVTLLRAGLVCLVGGTLLASGSSSGSSWSVAGLIALALTLDGLDGWLARRLRLTSAFGARFDVEVDALLLLILALLVWQSGKVDAWILTIGLLRYVFVLASWLHRPIGRPLPESRRRKTVCVMQGVALLICLLPPVVPSTASIVATIALTALVASFATDLRWLLQSRPAQVPARRLA